MYLYIIKCQEFHKIGVANDVENRLAQLSTGNPYPLEVQTIYEFENAEPVERAIHQRYKSARQRGEWFTLGYDDLKNIHQICLALGGNAYEYSGGQATEADIEEADDENIYTPTMADVERVMKDSNYRLEYRSSNKGVYGLLWRSRVNGRDGALYIGRTNPIFEAVKALAVEAK